MRRPQPTAQQCEQSGGQTGFSDSSNAGKAIIVNRYGGSPSSQQYNASNANITNGFGATRTSAETAQPQCDITNNSTLSAFYSFRLGFFKRAGWHRYNRQ